MIKLLTKCADMLFLTRFPLLAPVWTILILGWIVGSPDAGFGKFEYGTLFITTLGFSLLVASIYIVNQIQDIESDRINRKLFLLPHGIISIPTAWTLATLCTVAGMVIAAMLGFWMLILFAAGFFTGILYNLPPASLKNRAIGGVAANALGHGMITFMVGWVAAKTGTAGICEAAGFGGLCNIAGAIKAGLTGWETIPTDVMMTGILSSLAPGLANAAVFLATTIPDAEGDARTGKRTFCVAYGAKATAITAAVMCALTLAVSFVMENHFWIMTATAALSLIFFVYSAITAKVESAFYAFKWPVFLLSIFVTIYVPIYGGLILFTFVSSRIYYKYRFGITYPTFKPK